jgi:hypothetical protein
MKKTYMKKGMVSGVLLLGIIIIISCFAIAETGTRLSDADEAHSSAADDAAEYQTNPSVALDAGEYITEEVDEFNDGTISVYFDSQATNQELRIRIENSDDSDDYFYFDVICVSTTETKIEFHDHFSGNSEAESESKAVDTYSNTNGAWTKITIEIQDTADDTDGSRKKVTIDIDGTEFIEEDMISPELSTDIKTREWDTVKFRASSSNSGEINIDDWDIDTGKEGSSYTWTLWILAGIILYLLVALLFIGTWPFNNNFWKPWKRGSGKIM